MTQSGRVTKRWQGPTTIPQVAEALGEVPRPRKVVFEEGPLADWLLRNLEAHADEVVVCEPRRNALIAKDSDKDDPIDAEKLADLLRGGYVKPVHHPENQERAIFKQHVPRWRQLGSPGEIESSAKRSTQNDRVRRQSSHGCIGPGLRPGGPSCLNEPAAPLLHSKIFMDPSKGVPDRCMGDTDHPNNEEQHDRSRRSRESSFRVLSP
jgi:hypothetical protein